MVVSTRNYTVNENSIAQSADLGSLEIAGVNLMYEGTRVKSWLLGRDLNPGGRGDGSYYGVPAPEWCDQLDKLGGRELRRLILQICKEHSLEGE